MKATTHRPTLRRSTLIGGALIGGALIAAVLTGCGDDSFDLANTTSTSSVGGAGGTGGTGGSSSSTSTAGGAAAGGSGGAGGEGIVEPPGATTLTLVNGVVDNDSVRYCFVPYPDGATTETPWPTTPTGMPFGESAQALDVGEVIAPGKDIELVGFAGNLVPTFGANCAQVLSQPAADLKVWSFGILPASAFEQDKDLLLVTSGCMGADDHTDLLQTTICGIGYTPSTPTASVVAGFMSRLTELPGKVPMQFAQASRALPQTQLRVRPGQDGAVAQLVENQWAWGAIAPYPPYNTFSRDALGSIGNTRIELTTQGSANPIAQVPFASIFLNSGLSETDVQDGEGLVFIAIGSSSGIAPGSWWNGFRMTAVKANPAAR